jgi:hypothetical protein
MALAFTVFFTVSGAGLVFAGTKPATYPTPTLAYISGTSSIGTGQPATFTFNVTFSDGSMVPFSGTNLPVTFTPAYTPTGGGFHISNSSHFNSGSAIGKVLVGGTYYDPTLGPASVLASHVVTVN